MSLSIQWCSGFESNTIFENENVYIVTFKTQGNFKKSKMPSVLDTKNISEKTALWDLSRINQGNASS